MLSLLRGRRLGEARPQIKLALDRIQVQRHSDTVQGEPEDGLMKVPGDLEPLLPLDRRMWHSLPWHRMGLMDKPVMRLQNWQRPLLPTESG